MQNRNTPQATQALERDLVKASLQNKNPNLNITPTHKQTLTKLSKIFSNASQPPRVEVANSQLRLGIPTHTKSNYTTTPHHMAKINLNHQK